MRVRVLWQVAMLDDANDDDDDDDDEGDDGGWQRGQRLKLALRQLCQVSVMRAK